MPTGGLGEGVIYLKFMSHGEPITVKLEVDGNVTKYESITRSCDPEEFSFEVKLTRWQMLKIICKSCGFWYTLRFIFARLWNRLVALFKKN